MKINKTDFNPTAVKKMGFYKFKKDLGHLLNIDAELAWFKITGKEIKRKASQPSITPDAILDSTKDE